MLGAAIETVAEGTEKSTVHSDRGGSRWLSRVARASLTRFMSRKSAALYYWHGGMCRSLLLESLLANPWTPGEIASAAVRKALR